MTSGVKQALPQVLMPGAGAKGKAAHGRMQQGDFAEALGMGKATKQARSDTKADRQDIDIRASAWPRLPSRLDGAIEDAREAAPEADTPDFPSKAADETDEPGNRTAPRTVGNMVSDTRNIDPVPPSALPPISDPSPPAGQRSAWEIAPTVAKKPGVTTPPVDAPLPQAMPSAKESQPVVVERHGVRQPSPSALGPAVGTLSFTSLSSGARPESVRFEPALAPADSVEKPSADRITETVGETPAESAKPTPRVTVLAQQNIPAPIPSTALVLVDSIAAGDVLGASSRLSLEAVHASQTHGSAQSLKIQLHPAELGMVTATLRFAGEQLSIELQVENQEAHRRLVGDSETIVRALRDLGYAVDQVTVLQPSIASTPAARTDMAASFTSSQGRSADASGSGSGNGGSSGFGERSSGEGGNAGHDGRQNASPRKQGSGGSLYI